MYGPLLHIPRRFGQFHSPIWPWQLLIALFSGGRASSEPSTRSTLSPYTTKIARIRCDTMLLIPVLFFTISMCQPPGARLAVRTVIWVDEEALLGG